jgi:hypothetical protein
MLAIIGLLVTLAASGAVAVQGGVGTHASDARSALDRLGVMVGGEWLSEGRDANGKPFVTLRYEWGPDRKSIRGAGTIAGTAVAERLAWDASAGKVYYVDFHGTETVYFGHYTLNGDTVVLDFKALVGSKGTWRARAAWPDRDTYSATIVPVVDGKEREGHAVKLHRTR